MKEFERFIGEVNKNVQQITQAMIQMQGLYKSFSQMSPMWKQLYTLFQVEEQPTVQVSRSRTHTPIRQRSRNKGSIRKKQV